MRYVNIPGARRPAFLALILSTVASILIFLTCDDVSVRPDQTTPTARLISKTACKGSTAHLARSSASECSQDCLQYWSESDGTLHVKHLNAAFNCCMESLSVNVEIRGEVALVTENDGMIGGGCKCLCLYDAEYEISNLPTTVHKIEIAEPYAKLDQWPEEKPLCCSFTLPVTDTSSCCVDRCHYPWGFSPGPRITLVSRTDCKVNTLANTDSLGECVEWEWQTAHALLLKHTNVMFNCCLDTLDADIAVHGDTVVIIERERNPSPCDCLCLYDVTLLVENLVPGTYHFIIRYGVWDEGIPKLAWTADLLHTPSGKYCRSLYCGPDWEVE